MINLNENSLIFLIILVLLMFVFGIYIYIKNKTNKTNTTSLQPTTLIDEMTVKNLSNNLSPIINYSINDKYKNNILPDVNNSLLSNYDRISSCFVVKFIQNNLNPEKISSIKNLSDFSSICSRIFLIDNNLLFCYNDKQISAIDAINNNIDQNILHINDIIKYVKTNFKDDDKFIKSDYIDPKTNKMTKFYKYSYDFSEEENNLIENFIYSITFLIKISDSIFYALQNYYLNIITNNPIENKDLYNKFNKNFKYEADCISQKILNSNNIKNYSFIKNINNDQDYNNNYKLTNDIIQNIMNNGTESTYIKDNNSGCKETQLMAINKILEKLQSEKVEKIDIEKLLLYVLNNFNFGSYNEFSASDIVKINGYVN